MNDARTEKDQLIHWGPDYNRRPGYSMVLCQPSEPFNLMSNRLSMVNCQRCLRLLAEAAWNTEPLHA